MNNISPSEEITQTSMVSVDKTNRIPSSTNMLALLDHNSEVHHSSDSQNRLSSVNIVKDLAEVTEKLGGNDQLCFQSDNELCPIENHSYDVSSTQYTSASVTEEHNNILPLEVAKSTLKIHELRQFQIDCITALN